MFMFYKNQVEKLVTERQRLVLKKEKIDDRNNEIQAKIDNQIAKLRNKANHLQKACNDDISRIELQLDKVKKQIVLEKAFISGIDKEAN